LNVLPNSKKHIIKELTFSFLGLMVEFYYDLILYISKLHFNY
jgi:hypothetical protein